MNGHRPDPDALLAHVQAEDGSQRARGRLKVFLGATAGVGKTYAMLEEAQARRRDGTDVVAGVVETHGRKETAALLEGLDTLPRREIQHRGVKLTELDLDGALRRRPGLLLVDELAHTNAPESRHAKRWQDVEELVSAGIDVYTTVNVQHLESLNDLVARITHVRVRETVPDAVLERADEIELVDLPPGELLQRLREGKVYVPQQAQRATDHFFRKGNLIALRQMALRTAAARVDAQMRVYRRAHGVAETWPVAARVVVGVGPAPSSARLVRATRRMAERQGAEWTAVFVETPEYEHWPERDRARVWETLRLAETLGARTVTLSGTRAGDELLDYARAANAATLVVGKPSHPRWRDLQRGSKLDAVVRGSGDIDVYVISGDADDPAEPRAAARPRAEGGDGAAWRGYAAAAAGVAAATVVAVAARPHFEPGNLIMVFLLTVVLVAVRRGRGPAVAASILGVASFDWFCVPPYHTFAVADTEYLVTFAAMLVVALVIGTLTARLRDQARTFRRREHRAAALYEVSRALVRTTEPGEALRAGLEHVRRTFDADAAVYLPDPFGQLQRSGGQEVPDEGVPDEGVPAEGEAGVARWVFDHAAPAGRGTTTFPAGEWLHLPLASGRGAAGVLAVRPRRPDGFRDPELLHLLETFADQVAAAVERARLAEETRRVRELEEMDRMKSEFVAVAAHELRTPLSSLLAGAHLLEERAGALLPVRDREVLSAVRRGAERLNSLADRLLDLSRYDAGEVVLSLAPVSAAALVAAAVDTFSARAAERGVELARDDADGLPAVRADEEQAGRVLANLLANALRHAPPGGHVLVSADAVGDFVQISVADDGPGVPLADQTRIFDRFVAVGRPQSAGGAGLGLALAREIVRAHGGTLWVDSGPGPGSVFSFTLPVAEQQGDEG